MFSHGGHLGWLAGSPDTFFKLDTPMMIVAKFGFIWPSSVRGEDFCRSYRRRTTTPDDAGRRTTPDAGRKVMGKAHLALRAR